MLNKCGWICLKYGCSINSYMGSKIFLERVLLITMRVLLITGKRVSFKR